MEKGLRSPYSNTRRTWQVFPHEACSSSFNLLPNFNIFTQGKTLVSALQGRIATSIAI